MTPPLPVFLHICFPKLFSSLLYKLPTFYFFLTSFHNPLLSAEDTASTSQRNEKLSEVAHLPIPKSTILPAPVHFLLLPSRFNGGSVSSPIILFLLWTQSLFLHIIISSFLIIRIPNKLVLVSLICKKPFLELHPL